MRFPLIPDKLFDSLKWICIAGIPAIIAFWIVISTVWDIPYSVEIAKTLAAVNALLGAFLGVSTVQYNAEKTETKNKKENGLYRNRNN